MGYTTEDEALIREKWDDLLFSCSKICKNDEDWNFIKRAFWLCLFFEYGAQVYAALKGGGMALHLFARHMKHKNPIYMNRLTF